MNNEIRTRDLQFMSLAVISNPQVLVPQRFSACHHPRFCNDLTTFLTQFHQVFLVEIFP